MSDEALLTKLREESIGLSAAELAELFLSPFVDARLMNEVTRDEGAPMWIVNRSDVYDATLESLKTHPLEGIRTRAQQKILQRRGFTAPLDPPDNDFPLEEVQGNGVEDVLGHPLCPFDAMVFFARSLVEDHRASACLSLTRRVVEYPPDWSINPAARVSLVDIFGRLLREDPSPYVRAYAARIPLFSESILQDALKNEKDARVFAKILQNPASTPALLREAISLVSSLEGDTAFAQRVLAVDQRLTREERAQLRLKAESDTFAVKLHDFYLMDASTHAHA